MAEVSETAQETHVEGGETQQTQANEEKDYKALYESTLAESRKWEKRAKENKTAADELDTLKKSQMTVEERNAATERERDELKAQLESIRASQERTEKALEVSEKTGVPASLLSGFNVEEMDAKAAEIAMFAKSQETVGVNRADGKQKKSAPLTGKEAFAQFFEQSFE